MTKEKLNHLYHAIVALDATDEEQQALVDILHVEGFGGSEYDAAVTFETAKKIAEEQLIWLRNQREHGLR